MFPLQLAGSHTGPLRPNIHANLRVAASSAAEPTYWATSSTYESASGQITVTSHDKGFPLYQRTRVSPSGLFPSDLVNPCGSLVAVMPAEAKAQATRSIIIINIIIIIIIIIRSTPKSRPNKVGLRCLSVRSSTKVFPIPMKFGM